MMLFMQFLVFLSVTALLYLRFYRFKEHRRGKMLSPAIVSRPPAHVSVTRSRWKRGMY